MAFPQTAAPTEASTTANPSSINITLPATVNADALLLIAVAAYDNSTPDLAGSGDNGEPSGWTLLETAHLSANWQRGWLLGRKADGTEGGTSVTIDFDQGDNAVAHAYHVTDWSGTLGDVETARTTGGSSQSSNPNPPSLSPAAGADDYLWFAFAFGGNDDGAYVSAPTNYTGGVGTVTGAGNNDGAQIMSARRELNASSEDPGTFEWDLNDHWAAITAAIPPGTAGGGGGAAETASVSEAISLSDSEGAAAAALGSHSEAISLSDSDTGLAATASAISEDLVLLSAQGALAGALAGLSDPVSLGDTQQGQKTILVDISEAVSLSDSEGGLAAALATASEALSLGDAETALAASLAALAEAVSLGDTPAAQAAAKAATSAAVALLDSQEGEINVVPSPAEGPYTIVIRRRRR